MPAISSTGRPLDELLIAGRRIAALLKLGPNLPGEQMTIFGVPTITLAVTLSMFAPGGGQSGRHTVATAELK